MCKNLKLDKISKIRYYAPLFKKTQFSHVCVVTGMRMEDVCVCGLVCVEHDAFDERGCGGVVCYFLVFVGVER